jgi:anti-sigma B factor antagonist
MPYQARNKGDLTVIEVVGELDVATATELSEYLRGVMKKFPKKLVLDLSGVRFMASSGLAMLISTLKRSKESRISFGICGLTPVVRQTIEVTTLHEVLPIFDDVDDADQALT